MDTLHPVSQGMFISFEENFDLSAFNVATVLNWSFYSSIKTSRTQTWEEAECRTEDCTEQWYLLLWHIVFCYCERCSVAPTAALAQPAPFQVKVQQPRVWAFFVVIAILFPSDDVRALCIVDFSFFFLSG